VGLFDEGKFDGVDDLDHREVDSSDVSVAQIKNFGCGHDDQPFAEVSFRNGK
jgi:hypothetical protein